MIKDKIENAELYFALHPLFEEAFLKLQKEDLTPKTDGKLYFNFDKYETKPEKDGKFEAHKRYIDIQYIKKGSEKIGVCDTSNTISIEKYNEEKDVEFLKTNSADFITLNKGEFAIFFPHDAHMPCLVNKNYQNVEKIVAKIKF